MADFLTRLASDFIERHAKEPFFLYLAHFGVHSPYQAKATLTEKFEQESGTDGHHDATYAAMIASVDESVGVIVELLDELGLSDNTLVVFSSDSGGVGGYQRQGFDARDVTDNSPLRGGKGMLYEGGIRVPYIFRWLGAIAENSLCDEPMNSVDLYPTCLELAGADAHAPVDQTLDGVSLLGLLQGDFAAHLDRKLFWHFPGYLGSGSDTWRTKPVGVVRDGNWKLVEFFEDGRRELYDLGKDIGENDDLAEKMPDKVRALSASLATWQQGIGAQLPTPSERQKAD